MKIKRKVFGKFILLKALMKKPEVVEGAPEPKPTANDVEHWIVEVAGDEVTKVKRGDKVIIGKMIAIADSRILELPSTWKDKFSVWCNEDEIVGAIIEE